MSQCQQCQQEFQITDQDRDFYHKIDVPEPVLCPDCRHQRRYIFRNERSLYLRKCDSCGQEIVSVYSAETPYKVYCRECYFNDQWEALDCGREFDFSRPFFEQFQELKLVVPRLGLDILKSTNSDYSNIAINNKNCYLVFGTTDSEDCYYTRKVIFSKDCVDVNFGQELELCYQCIDCYNCYDLIFSQRCSDCSFSGFLYNCVGVENCFLCSNLRHQKYCFLNQQLSQEEYERKVSRINSLTKLKKYQFLFQELKLKTIHRENDNYKSIDCSGDHLVECKNCKYCYDLAHSEDCKYCTDAMSGIHLSMDCSSVTIDCEGDYECSSCSRTGFSYFCHGCRDGNFNLFYSDSIYGSNNLFGCIGLRNKKYCIFNKQYSEKDYQELKVKIITQMRKSGEWGQFFPISHSPFCYNESAVQDYYPLAEAEAINRGYKWKPKDKKEYQGQTYEIPDSISELPETITQEVLACLDCGKNYKIIPQELKFYRKMELPIPQHCPDCRHLERTRLRNPRKLWDRQCTKCGKKIKTTYTPERPEKVYCEECYQKEVY